MNKSLVCSVLNGGEESERVIIHGLFLSYGSRIPDFLLKQPCTHRHYSMQWQGPAQIWSVGVDKKNTSLLTPQTVAGPGETALVVDSLSSLLLLLQLSPPGTPSRPPSAASLCRWLLTLHHNHILCLLHSDLHEESVLLQMNSIATSIIRVSPVQVPLGPGDCKHYAGTAHTTHRKLSGRILKQTEVYSVAPNFVAMETVDSIHSLLPQVRSTGSRDPAANLTFDLHLSAEEKAARSQVVLPYTSAQQGEGLVGMAETGKIFYQPDELDIFDDSDPDDDLDF